MCLLYQKWLLFMPLELRLPPDGSYVSSLPEMATFYATGTPCSSGGKLRVFFTRSGYFYATITPSSFGQKLSLLDTRSCYFFSSLGPKLFVHDI
jgi:hypothetical protein